MQSARAIQNCKVSWFINKKDNADILKLSSCLCIALLLQNIRLVFNRCIDFINKNIILNKKQFGFTPKHSTYMAFYW